jgi:uncharacterized SAM-binding protein YcdF (DUF218 family)
MFLIKKLISAILFPLPISIGLLIAGLSLLWFTRRQRAGKIFVTIGLIVLLLSSYEPVTDPFLYSLERRYPPLLLNESNKKELSSVKWVVVLGSGYTEDPQLPVTSWFTSDGMFRFTEAIRIHKAIVGSRLIFSGGDIFNTGSVAEGMKTLAESIGIDEQNILLETRPKDTEEEARLIKETVKDESFIVVTSAYHMPRAMALLTKEGMSPIPAPTFHTVKKSIGTSPDIIFPKSTGIIRAEILIHEYLGYIWSKLRGKA